MMSDGHYICFGFGYQGNGVGVERSGGLEGGMNGLERRENGRVWNWVFAR